MEKQSCHLSGGFYIVHETDERNQCQGKQKKGILKTTRQEISQCAEIEEDVYKRQSSGRWSTKPETDLISTLPTTPLRRSTVVPSSMNAHCWNGIRTVSYTQLW